MDLQPALAPKTVNNFVNLARQGSYDGHTFHRYVEGFVIQGGDPTGTAPAAAATSSRTSRKGRLPRGRGGDGQRQAQHQQQPVLHLQRRLPEQAGPQPHNLFGFVVSGQDVVNSLRQGDVMTKVTVEERES